MRAHTKPGLVVFDDQGLCLGAVWETPHGNYRAKRLGDESGLLPDKAEAIRWVKVGSADYLDTSATSRFHQEPDGK
jgi:hypothetical protein